MTGQLNQHPLAELIREISALNLSGVLRLSRERAKAVIYFEAGEVIYAASNLRAYRLAECARRWGALTEQQLARAQGTTSDLEFSKALLETKTLNRDALDELVAHQISEMLCHVLLWLDGEWDYDPRVRLSGDIRAQVKTEELLMESARRLPVELVASRLRDRDGRLSFAANTDNSLALMPAEAFVLSRVDSSLSLNELLALSGLPESETLRLTYILALGGLLRFDNWPKALTDQVITQARSVATSKPGPDTPLASPKKIAAGTKPEPPPQEPRDERQELDELFARLEIAVNYYQILGVVRPTKDADIKRAYHSLAKRFHPDRFRKTVDEATHARIETAFAKIAQAYETLKDKSSRAIYDTKLLRQEEAMRSVDAQSSSKTSDPVAAHNVNSASFQQSDRTSSQTNQKSSQYQAEEQFQQGLSALRHGNSAVAIGCLGEAARLEPMQPRYRAYFGQALAKDERLRRNAESEFKAAISLDANNASYRVMLAELYHGLGLLRRAQGELERALSVDPRNEDARRLLDKLKQ